MSKAAARARPDTRPRPDARASARASTRASTGATPPGETGPRWGTARALGLPDGAVVTYYGHFSPGPVGRGIKVRVNRPHGSLALTTVRGNKTVLSGGAAIRFWASWDPDSVAAAGPTAADFSTPDAVRAARIDGHPGATWLAMMKAANLSQTETARRMGVAAVSLNRLVRGKGIPTARITVRFARAVGADERTVWEQVCDYELSLALRERRTGGRRS